MTRRTAPLLGLVSCVAALAIVLLAPRSARADTGTVGLSVGALVIDSQSSTEIMPTLRAEASLRLAGPLYGGAFLQATGESLPLSNAHVAGGLFATLRFDLPGVGLKLFASGEAGRIAIPSQSQGSVDAWSASAVGGIDLPMLDGKLWLDVRAGHTWLFARSSPTVGAGAWTASVGVTVPLD